MKSEARDRLEPWVLYSIAFYILFAIGCIVALAVMDVGNSSGDITEWGADRIMNEWGKVEGELLPPPYDTETYEIVMNAWKDLWEKYADKMMAMDEDHDYYEIADAIGEMIEEEVPRLSPNAISDPVIEGELWLRVESMTRSWGMKDLSKECGFRACGGIGLPPIEEEANDE